MRKRDEITRRTVHQIQDISELKDDMHVRLGNQIDAPVYTVRVEELRGGGTGVRLKDPLTNENVHFHTGTRAMCEAGVLWTETTTPVYNCDIWAKDDEAWLYDDGQIGHGRSWLQIVPLGNAVRSSDIPNDAVLIWRVKH